MTDGRRLEAGQIIGAIALGAYEVPDWVDSMFSGIYREWRYAYWNIIQKEFSCYTNGDIGSVHFRAYYWGDDENHDPRNFWIDGVDQAICWYKYPGRGMSCSVDYSPSEWISWHDAVLAELRRADKEHWNKVTR